MLKRVQSILFLLAEGKKCYWRWFSAEAHTSVPGTSAIGGWEWRGRWSERCDEGPMLRGSQPKSRPRLMASPWLYDLSLENWSRHPDSFLPERECVCVCLCVSAERERSAFGGGSLERPIQQFIEGRP